jgi:hypothetical protein
MNARVCTCKVEVRSRDSIQQIRLRSKAHDAKECACTGLERISEREEDIGQRRGHWRAPLMGPPPRCQSAQRAGIGAAGVNYDGWCYNHRHSVPQRARRTL